MSAAADVLDRLARHGRSAGLVTDFDGVLAPITADPAASRMLDGTDRLLDGLADRLGLVAVLSGRPASFLVERVGAGGLVLLGSYGAERVVDGVPEPLPELREWAPQVAAARRQLVEQLSRVAGVHVEDKTWSVAAHWRQSPDRDTAQREVQRVVGALSGRTGLRAEPGKYVLELRPPVDVDKGTALRRAAAGSGCTVLAYAGDDRGDLPAFAAAQALGGHALVVHGAETADEVAAVDGVHFAGPEEFRDWLAALLARLGGPAVPG